MFPRWCWQVLAAAYVLLVVGWLAFGGPPPALCWG